MKYAAFFPEPGRRGADGFWISELSLSSLLARHGIYTYHNEQWQTRRCEDYFDDWHLYRIPAGEWGLFKIREQEHDGGDGDTPGVTVSFVAFDMARLERCLQAPTDENRRSLGMEINRVVAWSGQRHSGAVREYFCRVDAEGPYLMAELYVEKLASLVQNGGLSLPEKPLSPRVQRFLEQSGVCREGRLLIPEPGNLTPVQRRALLAAFTGNCSLHSFAAEVRFHAKFLVPRLPRIYASALRADMTPLRREFLPVMPYYHPGSHWVKVQRKALPQYDEPETGST